ncbi:hypothetical protein B484DRAFT_113157, partial [Ochromonadaceae sp. CCMP2298]
RFSDPAVRLLQRSKILAKWRTRGACVVRLCCGLALSALALLTAARNKECCPSLQRLTHPPACQGSVGRDLQPAVEAQGGGRRKEGRQSGELTAPTDHGVLGHHRGRWAQRGRTERGAGAACAAQLLQQRNAGAGTEGGLARGRQAAGCSGGGGAGAAGQASLGGPAAAGDRLPGQPQPPGLPDQRPEAEGPEERGGPGGPGGAQRAGGCRPGR